MKTGDNMIVCDKCRDINKRACEVFFRFGLYTGVFVKDKGRPYESAVKDVPKFDLCNDCAKELGEAFSSIINGVVNNDPNN